MKLTERQQQFCHEMMADNNPTAAAQRAGYASGRNAGRLLKNPAVAAELERLRAETPLARSLREAEIVATLTEVLRYGEKESDRLRAAEILSKRFSAVNACDDCTNVETVIIYDDMSI